MDEAYLVESVRRRIDAIRAAGEESGAASPHPPLSPETIAAAERQLGFALPPTLRALYARVGHGGFGPAYGLLGLVGGARQEEGLDAVGVYQRSRRPSPGDPHWTWPEGLLPLVHLGCAMFLCVDCSDTSGMVVWFEPNPHADGQPWDDAFFPL